MKNKSHMYLGAFAAASMAVSTLGSAQAADKIRFAKVIPHPFMFTLVDLGVERGIFAKNGIELNIFSTGGSAKLHQALAADSADIGIGSGPGLGFVARGAPVIAIAASHGAPRSMGVVVTKNSPLYDKKMTIADLKGKKIGISTPSSLTFYLAHKLALENGWGTSGVQTVALGKLPAQMAAAKAGNIDAFVMSADVGNNLEVKGSGRLFLNFGDYVKDFHTHVLYSTNKYRKANPDAVKRFLKGWFETVKLAKSDKQAWVKTAIRVTKLPLAVANRAYDEQGSMVSDTGRFDAKALAVIAEGLVVTKILKTKPDMSKLYTEEYLPK